MANTFENPLAARFEPGRKDHLLRTSAAASVKILTGEDVQPETIALVELYGMQGVYGFEIDGYLGAVFGPEYSGELVGFPWYVKAKEPNASVISYQDLVVFDDRFQPTGLSELGQRYAEQIIVSDMPVG